MVVVVVVNYLPVGVRIWFRVNCGGRVFGVRVSKVPKGKFEKQKMLKMFFYHM